MILEILRGGSFVGGGLGIGLAVVGGVGLRGCGSRIEVRTPLRAAIKELLLLDMNAWCL